MSLFCRALCVLLLSFSFFRIGGKGGRQEYANKLNMTLVRLAFFCTIIIINHQSFQLGVFGDSFVVFFCLLAKSKYVNGYKPLFCVYLN